MLTDRYLNGVPEGSRARRGGSLSTDLLTDEALGHIRALNEIADGRGQTLAQLALSWALRDERVTSVLVGASSVRQLEDNLAAVRQPGVRPTTSWPTIERHAVDSGINLWSPSSSV